MNKTQSNRLERRLKEAGGNASTAAALMKRIDRLDAHIKFEFELMAQRVTYLAITESFLFSAYAVALANCYSANAWKGQIELLIYALPWVGISLAGVVLIAVVGAVSMTRKLKIAREAIDVESTGYFVHEDIGRKNWQHRAGLLPPMVVCIAFLAAWYSAWPSAPLPPAPKEQQATASPQSDQSNRSENTETAAPSKPQAPPSVPLPETPAAVPVPEPQSGAPDAPKGIIEPQSK